MSPLENLYYALGEIAYAIARADGKIQKEEKQVFHDMMMKEFQKFGHNVDTSEIIFKIMEKDNMDAETTYHWAIQQIRLYSHYLSPELKWFFVKVIEKIAAAYPPITVEEKNILDRFRSDITPLHGDPLFYDNPLKTKRT